jgi:hypothetical protein
MTYRVACRTSGFDGKLNYYGAVAEGGYRKPLYDIATGRIDRSVPFSVSTQRGPFLMRGYLARLSLASPLVSPAVAISVH